MAELSAEDQIAVLAGIQRILSEGQFTATYKFALLMAIADFGSGRLETILEPTVSTKAIAGKFSSTTGSTWRARMMAQLTAPDP